MQHGQAVAKRIRTRSGISQRVFAGMQTYPDKITCALVDAASDILEMSNGDLLEAFGHHALAYTSTAGCSEILAIAGSTFTKALINVEPIRTHLLHPFPSFTHETFLMAAVLLMGGPGMSFSSRHA